jgi:hypothetical protein
VFQSKPIQILRTLSSADLRRLDDFLASPLHNKNEGLLEAFRALREYHPSYESPGLERTALYERLFPGEDYDEKKLRYAFSDLVKRMEEFLVWLEFREEPFERDRLMLRSYQQRGLDKYVLATQKLINKRLAEHPYRNAEYLGMAFLTEKLAFQYRTTKKSHLVHTNLQQVVDSLDVWFLANKLKFSCEILNNRGVLNVDYELFLLDEILVHLKDRDLTRFPAIAIYAQILLTLTEPDEHSHYDRLLILLERYRHLFPAQEVFDMYVYAKNYCIVRINKGQLAYTRELFDFYNIILREGIIFRDGKLTQWDFKNMVTLGLRLEEFDWTEAFMSENRDRLDPAERDNVLAYNQANAAFHQGDHKRTLELLQQVEFTDAYYHLDSKALLLKTYYETTEWDSLQSLIEAYKVYLKRNKQISDYQKIVFGNLIRYTNTLVRYRRGRAVDLVKLSEAVEETKEIANLAWLRSKIQEAHAAAASNLDRHQSS